MNKAVCFYCSTCKFCTIIPCYIASHQKVSCLSYRCIKLEYLSNMERVRQTTQINNYFVIPTPVTTGDSSRVAVVMWYLPSPTLNFFNLCGLLKTAKIQKKKKREFFRPSETFYCTVSQQTGKPVRKKNRFRFSETYGSYKKLSVNISKHSIYSFILVPKMCYF